MAALVNKLIEVAVLRAECSARHRGAVSSYYGVRNEAIAVSQQDPK